jgi:hypothetical protein
MVMGRGSRGNGLSLATGQLWVPVLLGLGVAWVLAILCVVGAGSLSASIFYMDCVVAWSVDVFSA